MGGQILKIALGLALVSTFLFAGMNDRSKFRIEKRSHLIRNHVEYSEEQNLEKMHLLNAKRTALIEDIKRFIRESRNETQRAELHLRLGSLYMEDYTATLAKSQINFDKQQEEFKKKKLKVAPKFDNSEALAVLKKAITLYQELLARYPKHTRRDEMYFFLASAYLDEGKTSPAMSYFQQLLSELPNSKYANDTLIQLGDFEFDNNRFREAEVHFDGLIKRKYQPLLAYSYYKKAWCAYNEHRPQQALEFFKTAIELDGRESVSQVKVRNEALRDIALPFVDLKEVDSAVSFFKRFGDPHYRNGIEAMAQQYQEKGGFIQAQSLYELLLKENPNGAKNPQYEVAIFECYRSRNEVNKAAERLFTRMPLYLGNSGWYELNASNPKVVSEAQAQIEEAFRKFALEIHASAQKLKNDSHYDLAKQLYTKYLEHFPKNSEATQIRFYLAEILFKKEQYWPASQHYYHVYQDPRAGNLKQDSIQYALIALDKELNRERKKQGLSEINSKNKSLLNLTDTSQEVLPYTEVENKFMEVSTEYLNKFPTAKESPDILYSQSYLRYTHREFGEAYKGFWKLVQTYPAHSSSYAAASLILDLLNRKKDFPKLISACQKFLQMKELSKTEFRTEVADVLRKSELKRIQLLEEKQEFEKAATAYVDYTRIYGMQDETLYEKALYNAGINYTRAEMFLSALEVQEQFLRRFPKSPLRENMLLNVAKAYESLAQFEKSATYFESFSQLYPQHPQAKNAWRIAALYYWGSGNSSKAQSLLLSLLQQSSGNEAKLIERDLIDLYETNQSTDKLVSHYLEARAQKGIPYSDYLAYTMKIGELQSVRNGKRIPDKWLDEGMKVANKFRKEILQSPKGVEALSKLSFWMVYSRNEQFNRIKLNVSQSQMEANLQKKLALLKELEREYAKVVSLGSGEWGLASIFRTAVSYRQFAIEIQTAPVPAELSGQQLEHYRAEIQKQMIKPFNEKALSLSVQCLEKAQEFNLLSQWTAKCYTLASQLAPERYAPVRTAYLPPVQVSLVVPSPVETKLSVKGLKNYSYPFYSGGLFQPNERVITTLAAIGVAPTFPDEAESLPLVPNVVTYRNLADERLKVLKSQLESERPKDLKSTSFAYLNLLRIHQPDKAIPAIQESIQRDPQNLSLHNLLGLAYLEANNIVAAKVTWLSMLSRGVKSAAVLNNLGVVSYLQGKDSAAIDYFSEATLQENPKEALSNHGFICLKYRNGFEAKKHFEKALEISSDDISNRVGLQVALLQNREISAGKSGLIDLVKRYRNDPYGRLSLAYVLTDIDKEPEMARQLTSEYVKDQNLGNDINFRQFIQNTKPGKGTGLPTID